MRGIYILETNGVIQVVYRQSSVEKVEVLREFDSPRVEALMRAHLFMANMKDVMRLMNQRKSGEFRVVKSERMFEALVTVFEESLGLVLLKRIWENEFIGVRFNHSIRVQKQDQEHQGCSHKSTSMSRTTLNWASAYEQTQGFRFLFRERNKHSRLSHQSHRLVPHDVTMRAFYEQVKSEVPAVAPGRNTSKFRIVAHPCYVKGCPASRGSPFSGTSFCTGHHRMLWRMFRNRDSVFANKEDSESLFSGEPFRWEKLENFDKKYISKN